MAAQLQVRENVQMCNIQCRKGIDIDIELGRKKGETTPREYWTRVWDEIHSSDGGPPDNLPTKALKSMWTKFQSNGRSPEEIWEHMENKYPGPFLLLPLLNRWSFLANTMSIEKLGMFDHLDAFTNVILTIKLNEDPSRFAHREWKLTDRESVEKIYDEHWDDIHSMNSLESCYFYVYGSSDITRTALKKCKEDCFGKLRVDDSENITKKTKTYQTTFPIGYKAMQRLSKLFFQPHDERFIFKEFDLFS